MKRYLKELVLLLAVFGGLPFDVMTDSPAYAGTPSLRVNGVKFPDGSNTPTAFNVKAPEYGAKGDGATDDTAAITAAITAANAAGGGRVFFPTGTYNVTQLAPTNDSNIVFAGERATISGTVDANAILLLTNCTHCVVTGLNIQHATHAARNSSGYGIFTLNSTDVVIEKNTLTQTCAAAVFTKGSTKVRVIGNYVHDTLADGIHTTGASTDVTVQANNLLNTGDDSIAVVGYQSDSAVNSRISIVGNTILQSNARGIAVIGTEQATITGNVVEQTTAAGIFIAQDNSFSSRGVQNVTVSSNIIKDANTYGTVSAIYASLVATSGNSSWPVTKVVFSSNTIYGGAHQSIFAGHSVATNSVDSIFVVGNKCYGNLAGNGIELDRVVTGAVIANTVSNAFGTGIWVDPTSGYVNVAENVVYFPNQGNAVGQFAVHNAAANEQTGNNYITADPGMAVLGTSSAPEFNLGGVWPNITASTSGVTAQNSPIAEWNGTAWNTGALASQPVRFQLVVEPSSGSSVTGNLSVYAILNGGARTKIARINSSGAYTGGGIGFNADNAQVVGASAGQAQQIWSYVYGTKSSSLASATTISPTTGLVTISGTTTITTINLPVTSFIGTLQFITSSALTFNTGGNIANAVTTAAGQIYSATYNGTSWFIK